MSFKNSYSESWNRLMLVAKEFEGATDRATAIVSGAFLDDCLAGLLHAYMVSDTGSDAAVFSGNGPLSTFSAKIVMAFRLGIISEDERSDLEKIRKIRNRFAHEVTLSSFEDQSTRDLCKLIATPLEMISITIDGSLVTSLDQLLKVRDSTISSREIFQQAVVHLMVRLGGRAMNAMQDRREPPTAFSEAHEPLEALLQFGQKQLSEIQKNAISAY